MSRATSSKVEAPLLGGELRVEDGLEQQVAEFLAQVGVVAGVDRRDDFVRLLQQPGAQRGVRLLAVPRAAAGRRAASRRSR